MQLQRRIFERLYRKARRVEELPWHREQPALLEQALARRGTPGTALDVGCGQGVHATYLAQQGYAVVGLDFVPDALDAARARAEQAGVAVELHECDVVDYEPPAPFDVVLDSGCLHHLPKSKLAAYRRRLDGWLAPGGDFVLVHFAHRGRIPLPMGPNHLTLEEAVERFAPFELQASDAISFDVPLPMGTMRAGVYWFTRPAS